MTRQDCQREEFGVFSISNREELSVLKEGRLSLCCKSHSTYLFGKLKVLGKLIWGIGNEDEFKRFLRGTKYKRTEFHGVIKMAL